MKITDTVKFREFLERKNYYNSVNVYGKMFRTHQTLDRYLLGSTSDELMKIYYFEKELRNAVFKKLIEVEANLKSTISHYFSLEYENIIRDNPYLNIDCYRPEAKTEKKYYDRFVKLKKTFQRILTNKYKPYSPRINNSVDHYIKSVGYVPLWVIIDELTFGELEAMFNLLTHPLQDRVCKSFGRSLWKSYGIVVRINPNHISSYMNCLRNLRNLVMHDRCLLYFSLHENTTHNPLIHKSRSIPKNSARQSLYDAIIVLQMFISKRNFDSFMKNIHKISEKTNKRVCSINFEDVLNGYGFPTNWLSGSGIDYNISLI